MKKHILFVGEVKYLRRQIAIIKEIERQKKSPVGCHQIKGLRKTIVI